MARFNFTKLLKRRYICHASIATGIVLTYVRITPCYDVSNDICYRNRIRAGVRTHLHQRANMMCNMRAPMQRHP